MPIIEDGDDLVVAGDLDDFEGAPFDETVVKAAGSAIRDAADWHIAPRRTETVVVESDGGRSVFLHTRHLVAVVSVRDVTDAPDGPLVTGYWVHATDEFREGRVQHPDGWPCGVLEFVITHGLEGCPASLAAVVAEIARAQERGDLAQRTLGDKSESWRTSLSATSESVLNRYTIEGFA